ncbi:hypothetical protein ABPG75_003231 [Micractinium tetrahymenae]
MSLFSFATWSILAVVAAVCLPPPRPPPAVLWWMTSVAALCLWDIVWRRRCRGAPHGGSYARWRELPALAFRVLCSGLGLAALLMQHWLGSREAVPAGAGGSGSGGGGGGGGGIASAVHDTVLLLFVSGLPAALQAWTWPLRISQAARDVCASLEAARLRVAHLAVKAARLLQQARFTSFGPTPVETLAEAHAECAAALSWLLLVPGTVLPALAQAAAECRRFRQHQRQRAQLGLPAERGWAAHLYGLLEGAADALSAPQALAAGWIALGILSDLARLASS